jgi:hypothetical protein
LFPPSLSDLDGQGGNLIGTLCQVALMTSTKRIPRKRTSLRKGPVCSICKHEHRVLIESIRIAGASLDTISSKYGVSRDSIFRHMRAHVPDDLRAEYLAAVPLKELAEKAATEGISVLQYLSLIRATLMTQLQLAASVHDRHGTSALAGKLNETLRLIGNISGELGDMAARTINIGTINVLNSPVYLDLRQELLRALQPFPDARRAVAAALQHLEERQRPPLLDVTPQPAVGGGAHAGAN